MGSKNINIRLPISVKGIVIEDEGVWLRKNERSEWELPGGKIDQGEQPKETLVRELKEELGFETVPLKPVDACVYRIRKSEDETAEVFVVIFLCKLVNKFGQFELQGEAGKAEFAKFSIQEIDGLNMPEFYKAAIRLGSEDLSEGL